MNTRITGLFPYNGKNGKADIFGYSTNGIPGLEIVGMGRASRSIKEKFVFLSRKFQVDLPLRRYVLCVESNKKMDHLNPGSLEWLELPLLILYWSLAGHLPISKLDDCFCSGRLSISGVVQELEIESGFLNRLDQEVSTCGGRIKYISSIGFNNSANIMTIPLEQLLVDFKITSVQMDRALISSRLCGI